MRISIIILLFFTCLFHYNVFADDFLVFEALTLDFIPSKAYFIVESKENEDLYLIESKIKESEVSEFLKLKTKDYIFFSTTNKNFNSKSIFVVGEKGELFISPFTHTNENVKNLLKNESTELESLIQDRGEKIKIIKLEKLKIEADVDRLKEDSLLVTHKDSLFELKEKKELKSNQLKELHKARKRIKDFLKRISLKEKPFQFELRQRELQNHHLELHELTKNTRHKEVDRLRIARMKMSIVEQTKGNDINALSKKLQRLKVKIAAMEKDLGYDNQDYDLW